MHVAVDVLDRVVNHGVLVVLPTAHRRRAVRH
jgi:hypothetical protein